MKTSFLFSVFLAATQFVPALRAETPAVSEHDAAIIQRYDTNKDGKLDDTEVAEVKEKMFMADQEKKQEKIERVQKRRDELIKEFDKNGDGKLDDAEKKEMETVLRARVEKRPLMLKRLDTDGDGKLSDEEWNAGREKIIGRLQAEKANRQK